MRRRRGWGGGLLLLVGLWLAVGCGGEDPQEALTTTRSMTARDEPAEPAYEDPLAAFEAALEEEPAAAPAAPGNRAPRLTGIQIDPARGLMAGMDVTVVAHANDPDGDEVEYLYTWWVDDEQLEVRGPVLSTADLKRGDVVRVQVVASDGRADSTPLSGPPLEVTNGLPRILSRPGGARADGVFRYQVRAEDPDGDRPLRYSLVQAPPGMRVGAVTGLVEWTPGPGQEGTHPVGIAVADAAGGRVVQTFELEIQPPPAAPAP